MGERSEWKLDNQQFLVYQNSISSERVRFCVLPRMFSAFIVQEIRMPKETLAEQIANHLRRDILRGNRAPGMSVKERDIASDMNVSRTPIREAIRILSKEGLVELRPSRSPIVALSDFKEIADQTEVLIAPEKLSAELACKNATEADLKRLETIVAYMAEHYNSIDPLDMFEVDMSFHTAIAVASGNKALAETHGTFLRRLWRARYLAARQRRNRERVVNQHTAILDAMHARDGQAARDAINNHLQNLADDIQSVIQHEIAHRDS
ncbi:GntR family transcriptional regulator [Hoeflea phototrophica]|nr:GntR family transcriptional regulator [Hoeflea phototrophica]